MSDDIEGVVETSLNVGVITTDIDKITILCLIRSLIDSGRSNVEGMLTAIAELAGVQCEFSGATQAGNQMPILKSCTCSVKPTTVSTVGPRTSW